MKTDELRKVFTNYFKNHGHTIVPSYSLVPGDDPSLLFTNAGMVQFKNVFLGQEKRSYTRAASVQCCMRASGKHNDLENVGLTARHHTFFEMMGNFSFGDYFKKEAIHYAWDFLINVLKINPEKLWITVYEKDKESEELWLKEIKVNPKHFSRCGDKDNFWTMGDTGPCGPCTEIFYDHGEDIPGGPPGSKDQEGDRYVEIWNLVFMQYNRDSDGNLTPLPKLSVDTGAGLERLAAVMQGVHNNYDIDLFKHIIDVTAKLTLCRDHANPGLRVIADHIRSTSFLILNGVTPSNEGRGYVLRRIIRRAVRFGNKLGVKKPFFYKLVQSLVEVMGEAYPELVKAQKIIETVILREEEQFAITLQQGLKILMEVIEKLKTKKLPGATVFKLYDTYGFPIDLTAIIASEYGLTIDEKGFEKEMAKQREQSQAASQFKVNYGSDLKIESVTDFTGYESLATEAKVMAIFHEDKPIDSLNTEEEGCVVLDKTPFYAESGGQVGDVGEMKLKNGLFLVQDTQKAGAAFLHFGVLKSGTIKVGDKVEAQINVPLRQATALNHTATHLMHGALQQVLGKHVVQKGSLVTPHHLRFDFSHFKQVTSEELRLVEDIVNEKIRENIRLETELTGVDEAKKRGAMALFGEKYGETVRVLHIGDFSLELCGGTHVDRTGDIGLFKIISETGIAAGIRRIEAVTGEGALNFVKNEEDMLKDSCNILKTNKDLFVAKLGQLTQEQKKLEKTVTQLKEQLAGGYVDRLIAEAKEVKGVKVIVAEIPDIDQQGLRVLVEKIKNKAVKAVVALAKVNADKTVNVITGVSKSCMTQCHAGELVKEIAALLGGKGGGRPDIAQGGGDKPLMLTKALAKVADWVRSKV